MKIRFFLFLLFIPLVCALLLGCSEQSRQEESNSSSESGILRGGTYRVPLANSPPTLDPVHIQDIYGIGLANQIFTPLVQFGPYLSIRPGVAETWEVLDNGRSYRFFLQGNATFHNGQRVTVSDVVFSLKRLIRTDPPPAPLPHLLKIVGADDFREGKTENLPGLEPIDDYSLQIRLTEPHVPFITALGMYQASIVPQYDVRSKGDRFGKQPVGCGPFRFVSRDEDSRIVLERFSDFFDGPAYVDEIHYIIYAGGDVNEILKDFLKGELDEMPSYGDILDKIPEDRDYQWLHRPSLSLFFYGIRTTHPALQNENLRKALSLTIDRKELASRVYHDKFIPTKTILPPGMPGYTPPKSPPVSNMEAAKKHLLLARQEMGGNIPPLEIVSSIKSSFARAELKYMQEIWGKLGLKVHIKYMPDWSSFEQYIQSDSVQIYRYSWFADMPDPDSIMASLFSSDSPVNYMEYEKELVDEMLAQARSTVDPLKRANIYKNLERIILDDAPIIPLLHLTVDRIYQPYVKGIQMNALGAHAVPLHRIWLETSQSTP